MRSPRPLGLTILLGIVCGSSCGEPAGPRSEEHHGSPPAPVAIKVPGEPAPAAIKVPGEPAPGAIRVPGEPAPGASAEQAVLIDVWGSEARILRPPGFVRSPGHSGIWNVATQNSIRVVEEDDAYAAALELYADPEKLAARDLSYPRRRELTIDGYDATLFLGRVLFGGEVWVRWTLVLGDETGTATIHATWPGEEAEALEEVNLEALTSVRWDRGRTPDPFAGHGFRLDPPDGLEFVRPYAALIRYGQIGVEEPIPADVTYLRIEELADLERPEDLELFARESLTRPGTINRIEVTRSEEVTIAGLPGFELFADARTKRGALPVKTYLLVLFDRGRAFHVFGLTGAEGAEPNLTSFRRSARSLVLVDYGD